MSGPRAAVWQLCGRLKWYRGVYILPYIAKQGSTCGDISQPCAKLQQLPGALCHCRSFWDFPLWPRYDAVGHWAVHCYELVFVELCRELGITPAGLFDSQVKDTFKDFKGPLFICSGSINARSLRSRTRTRSKLNASGRLNVCRELWLSRLFARVPWVYHAQSQGYYEDTVWAIKAQSCERPLHHKTKGTAQDQFGASSAPLLFWWSTRSSKSPIPSLRHAIPRISTSAQYTCRSSPRRKSTSNSSLSSSTHALVSASFLLRKTTPVQSCQIICSTPPPYTN